MVGVESRALQAGHGELVIRTGLVQTGENEFWKCAGEGRIAGAGRSGAPASSFGVPELRCSRRFLESLRGGALGKSESLYDAAGGVG
jgi:hypothetical protein